MTKIVFQNRLVILLIVIFILLFKTRTFHQYDKNNRTKMQIKESFSGTEGYYREIL